MKYEKFEEWMIGKRVTHVYAKSSGVIVKHPDEGDPHITVRVKYDEGGLTGKTLGALLRNLDFLEEKPSEEANTPEGSQIDWEEGQEVWCAILGKGVIDKISNEADHPISVAFEGGKQTYTLHGEMFSVVKCNRSLFFSEPVVTAELYPPNKPFTPTLKKGDRVHMNVKGGLFPEGVVREVFSEVEDRVYISEDGHYFMKYDIESTRILGEEIKFQ